MITLTNLSKLVPDGSKRGNITPAINRTVMSGTPLQNSINPIEKYFITGRFDLLPIANKIPSGKQKIIANIDITNVKNEDDLPDELIEYINYIETFVEVPIKLISVGPDRKQTIYRNKWIILSFL